MVRDWALSQSQNSEMIDGLQSAGSGPARPAEPKRFSKTHADPRPIAYYGTMPEVPVEALVYKRGTSIYRPLRSLQHGNNSPPYNDAAAAALFSLVLVRAGAGSTIARSIPTTVIGIVLTKVHFCQTIRYLRRAGRAYLPQLRQLHDGRYSRSLPRYCFFCASRHHQLLLCS